MKLSHSTLTLALLAAIAAPAAHAEIALDVIGGSEVSFEGLVQADSYWYDDDLANLNGAAGDVLDGTDQDFEMRRAELILKGKGPGNFEWVMGYDAKADKWLDVNLKYKFANNGNHYIQAGQFKQPNSLEELSSTRFNDFIAKASITNTFGVARRLGAAYHYGDTNWGVNANYFSRELTEHPASTPHGPGYGFRGYYAPINEAGSILHFGLSYVNFDSFHDTTRLRARPLADLTATRLVDTGSMTDSDRQATLGAEAFWVTGPFKLQGEYMQTNVERYRATSDDFSGSGGYISGVWNVTGETWGYKDGVPVTQLPEEPGLGMIQLGLRYDTIDLDDGAVHGGSMDSWTAGVNWYWRSNFKFALDYVMVSSDKNNVSDDPNILEARAQFYW